MNLFDLRGMVALVTGSSEGIGLACVNGLAAHGCNVVVSSRSASCEARAAQINAEHGDQRAIGVRCDVGDHAAIRRLVDVAVEHWGRLDCVVAHAAGVIDRTAWVEKIDEASFTTSFDANVTSGLVLTKHVVPVMRRQGGGSIIFTASTAGLVALQDHLTYGVVKASLIQMMRVLAVQLGPHNIRVNAVAPGVVASRGIAASDWADDELRRLGVAATPLGRPGTADEIAGCIVWLASPSGAFATGQTFVIDGGQSLKGMDGIHLMREEMRRRRGPAASSGRARIDAPT